MRDLDSQPSQNQSKSPLAEKYLLSVDGAGVFLLCLGDEVTIGGLRNDPNRADVCLMAGLLRKHLSLVRSNGSYHFRALGPVVYNDSPLLPNPETPVSLGESAHWKADAVEIRYRQPTVLSLTAVLEFPSHRPLIGEPPTGVDQVILMDQNCLIGPKPDQHIRLTDTEDGLILYRSKNQLWLKSKTPFSRNDQTQENSCSLESGNTVTGRDFRFRLEAVE